MVNISSPYCYVCHMRTLLTLISKYAHVFLSKSLTLVVRTLFTLMSKCADEADQFYKSLFLYCFYLMNDDLQNMSRVMRKPTFCVCENKEADQLRGNREADQRLCFRYIDNIIPLLSKSEISSL